MVLDVTHVVEKKFRTTDFARCSAWCARRSGSNPEGSISSSVKGAGGTNPSSDSDK
jgi:hypothetical protein